MAINVTQNLGDLVSFAPMQKILQYLNTYNCESQVVAVDANAYDIQSTGTKLAIINGQPEVIEVDDPLDVSAETSEVSLTAWATATAYSLGDIRQAANGTRIRCIQAHTSSADDEPFVGPDYDQYWEVAPHEAENASGWSIADGYAAWMLVTAKADGSMQLWKASDVTSGTTAEFKCPVYDPKLYVAIGAILYANSAGDSAADVIGNSTTCDFSTYGTIVQIVGPMIPHPDNIQKVC